MKFYEDVFDEAVDKNETWKKWHIEEKNALVKHEKIKPWIFNDPQIKQLIKDPDFVNSMKDVERKSQILFVSATQNFLGNCKAKNST